MRSAETEKVRAAKLAELHRYWEGWKLGASAPRSNGYKYPRKVREDPIAWRGVLDGEVARKNARRNAERIFGLRGPIEFSLTANAALADLKRCDVCEGYFPKKEARRRALAVCGCRLSRVPAEMGTGRVE